MRFFTQITRIVPQCAAVAVLSTLTGAICAPAQAQITYLPSFSVQNYTVTNGATNPAFIAPFVQLTPIGVKVSGVTIDYTSSVAGTSSISWLIRRPISVGPLPVTITHDNQLDGTLTYDAGITVLDMKLRTITTATDQDLNFLTLAPLPSGSPFNASASFGPYNQPTGSDAILQSFSIDFVNSGVGQQLHLTLPSSASSSVTAVPEPNVAAVAGIITLCFSYCLRRKRK